MSINLDKAISGGTIGNSGLLCMLYTIYPIIYMCISEWKHNPISDIHKEDWNIIMVQATDGKLILIEM